MEVLGNKLSLMFLKVVGEAGHFQQKIPAL